MTSTFSYSGTLTTAFSEVNLNYKSLAFSGTLSSNDVEVSFSSSSLASLTANPLTVGLI